MFTPDRAWASSFRFSPKVWICFQSNKNFRRAERGELRRTLGLLSLRRLNLRCLSRILYQSALLRRVIKKITLRRLLHSKRFVLSVAFSKAGWMFLMKRNARTVFAVLSVESWAKSQTNLLLHEWGCGCIGQFFITKILKPETPSKMH